MGSAKVKVDQLDLAFIRDNARGNTVALSYIDGLHDPEYLAELHKRSVSEFDELDREMTAICEALGDRTALAVWKERIEMFRTCAGTLESNLKASAQTKRQWHELVRSVGMIASLRFSAEHTVAINRGQVRR